jgi:hypothetical protein
MNDFYFPGVWAQRYKHLPPNERADIDKEVDRRFRARTGVARTLDPKKDQALAIRWLRTRDEVMAQMAGKGAPDRRKTSLGLVLALPSTMKNFMLLLLYNYDIGDHRPKPEHLKALNSVIFPLTLTKGWNFFGGVFGFASRTGGDSENQALSERRAAEVDKYLRQLVGSAITFFTAGGHGKKIQVSTVAEYHEAWPELESIDEDERDRSVVVTVQWQPVVVITAHNQPNIDWDKAFERASDRALLLYAIFMSTLAVADYAPHLINVKGVPVPWNPVTGPPYSWTTKRPADGDAVMKAIRPAIIGDIELSARNMKLNITRDEIERRYDEWVKNQMNKNVK